MGLFSGKFSVLPVALPLVFGLLAKQKSTQGRSPTWQKNFAPCVFIL
jgi:hypothetical protein